MKVKEKQFWNTIKKYLPGDVSRVENMVDEGTPDVTGACGADYWVELKVCSNKNKIRDVKKLLRPSQIVWHLRRGKEGSVIFVAVYYYNMKRVILYRYNELIRRYGRVYPLTNEKHNWNSLKETIINGVRSEHQWFT